MNYIEINTQINEHIETCLNGFKQYVESDSRVDGRFVKDFIQVTKMDSETFEFTSWWKFCIKKEFYPLDNVAIVSTYEIKIDDNGKKKLEHLPELDFSIDDYGGKQLLVDNFKKIAGATVNANTIIDFNLFYFKKFTQTVIEKHGLPAFSKVLEN